VNEPVATADEADTAIVRAEHGAWVLAALAHLGNAGALGGDVVEVRSDDDTAAAGVLVAAGLANVSDPGVTLIRAAPGLVESWSRFPAAARHEATMSIVRQVAATAGITAADGTGWGALDDATLLAQGRSSAVGGTMLATVAVPTLPGLAACFADGGRFLDVGTGVGELAAAFADALPAAHVVGLDVLPRAIELARWMIAARGLEDRVEVRLQGVEELAAGEPFDLAWVPAPFIPGPALTAGIGRVADALAPGGWVIVAAGRFDGDPLGVAVTRWQTQRAGGTPLDARDARELLTSAGLGGFFVVPTPPGGPALYAARREVAAGG
jgi:SAM-dependent methyltransferase